jgi:hypothetical protein
MQAARFGYTDLKIDIKMGAASSGFSLWDIRSLKPAFRRVGQAALRPRSIRFANAAFIGEVCAHSGDDHSCVARTEFALPEAGTRHYRAP